MENQVGGNDDGDVCRICRSPEGPENPLRYPCACRGSIKYVHQECLLLWLKRRGSKHCEVCKRRFSFVPVYAENAPERLSRREFLKGILLRALRLFAWGIVIAFNMYCFALHPLGQSAAVEYQSVFGVNRKFASFLASFSYNALIAVLMTVITLLRLFVEYLFGENGNLRGDGVVALVLWRYMRILCDWWHDHVVTCFIHFILVDPREDVIRLRHPQLQEFGAIRRGLFFLDDNAFAVLAISTCVSFFFVLLPLFMGKLFFTCIEKLSRSTLDQEMDESLVSRNSPIIVGYMVMLSLSFAYLGSFVTLRLKLIQTIATNLALGFLIIAAGLPYLFWILSEKVWRNLSTVKDGFILSLKFGVFPLILGGWLDFCIFPLLGTTISKRLEMLSDHPFCMTIHWMFGFICLIVAFNSMELIQKIIQKRAFWFLLDVTDPNYTITKLHFGQTLFALAFHGTSMVIVVHLPIKTISLISPSFFPLQLWINDNEYAERSMVFLIFAYVSVVRLGVIRWLTELIKPAIEPIVRKWVTIVSSWLHLSHFLLEKYEDQNVRLLLEQRRQIIDEWFLVVSIAEGSVVSTCGPQSGTPFEEDIDEHRFIILRIGLMLVLATLSLVLISTISMALPILMGRVFFRSISFIVLSFGIRHDDFYGFWIGCYILRAIYISTCFIVNHIKKGRTDLLLNFVLLWMRNVLLFSIWISVVPMLLGLLVDLMIIIPLQVPLDESPVYSLLQDWLIGLVLFHIWICLTMFTRVTCFATVLWRAKLLIIRIFGINQLSSTWLFHDVICAVIDPLLSTLGFPCVVAYSLFPLLGFSGAVNSAVQRFIWPVVLAMIMIAFVAKLIRNLFIYIHRVEYDGQYLVGNRLADFNEDS